MKVIFAGTPEFAAIALQGLLDKGYEIPLVLTQADRAAGRGLQLQASAVKQLAMQRGIPVLQPRGLRLDGKYPDEAAAAQQTILAASADYMVVAAYGLILPTWLLQAPRGGCLNIHASLLPRWRGAAPIHRAIEAGDAVSGVTIMQMDEGLDTGAMLLSQSLPLAAQETTRSLHGRLAELGARLIGQALQTHTQLTPMPQPLAGVSYAEKILKSESAIDWSQSAQSIERKIRAFNPAPGCTMQLHGETVKVWLATLDAEQAAAEGGIPVTAGDGETLFICELQRLGGKRMRAADYLRGARRT